ncbi:MAG: hypothetical protein Q4E22_00300 [Coriobacteriia bacterium]|nr:hypothetical protein [Coriobacteriia bacterium]
MRSSNFLSTSIFIAGAAAAGILAYGLMQDDKAKDNIKNALIELKSSLVRFKEINENKSKEAQVMKEKSDEQASQWKKQQWDKFIKQ